MQKYYKEITSHTSANVEYSAIGFFIQCISQEVRTRVHISVLGIMKTPPKIVIVKYVGAQL